MKYILGNSPITSIIGYLTAGLLAAQEVITTGETNWGKIVLAVCIAVLGRVSADARNLNK